MRPETFESLPLWLSIVKERTPQCAVMVIGNKRDSPETEPAVPTARAQAYATLIGAQFMEVSAKTGAGVTEAFQTIAHEFVRSFRAPDDPVPTPTPDYPRILVGAVLALALGVVIYRRL
jgi:hypothetical protein